MKSQAVAEQQLRAEARLEQQTVLGTPGPCQGSGHNRGTVTVCGRCTEVFGGRCNLKYLFCITIGVVLF